MNPEHKPAVRPTRAVIAEGLIVNFSLGERAWSWDQEIFPAMSQQFLPLSARVSPQIALVL